MGEATSHTMPRTHPRNLHTLSYQVRTAIADYASFMSLVISAIARSMKSVKYSSGWLRITL